MRVYLSSPYEHSRAEGSWKERCLKLMQESDPRVESVDPCPPNCNETPTVDKMKAKKDWAGMAAFCANIVERDLAMLRQCEGMICYLPAQSKTFGCTHELVFALDNRIPVVLVMPEGVDKVSHWLWGILGPTRIFDSLKDASITLVKRMQAARGETTYATVHNARG